MIAFLRVGLQLQQAWNGAVLRRFFSTSKDNVGLSFKDNFSPSHSSVSASAQSIGKLQKSQQPPPPPRELSQQALKAVWASQIIKTIIDSNPPTQLKECLRDRIMRLQIRNDKFDFDDKNVKDKVLQLFTSGVNIDQQLFSQGRIVNSIINQKLTFFPTSTVSKVIFKCIMDKVDHVIMGSFGIGKTISIVLFMQLSKHVNRLKYLALAEWIPEEKRQRYRQQLSLLTNEGLLVDTPKCWYWSIKSDLGQTEQDVKRLLIESQFDELYLQGSAQLSQIKGKQSLKDLAKFLNRLHLRNKPDKLMRPLLILDQVNAVTEYFRKWNQNIKRKIDLGMTESQAYQELIISKQQYLKPAKLTKQVIKNLRPISQVAILNSSQRLERKLIERLPQSYLISLDFFGHGMIQDRNISYSSELAKEEVKIEFRQFFLFLLEMSCRKRGKDKTFDSLKSMLSLQKLNVKSYYRALLIPQFFNRNDMSQWQIALSRATSKKKRDEIQEDFFKLFDNYCLEQSKQRLRYFITNDQRLKSFKRLILRFMILEAKMNKNQQKLTILVGQFKKLIKDYQVVSWLVINSQSQIEKTDLKLAQKLQEYDAQNKLKEYLISNDHNRQILPCKISPDNEKVIFDWTPTDFLQIAIPVAAAYQITTQIDQYIQYKEQFTEKGRKSRMNYGKQW